MSVTPSIVAPLIAYLLGCFSTAYYLVRWRTGEDVRTLGSGNAGARNAGRVLGRWGFLVTVAGDVGKGALAVWLARFLNAGEWAIAFSIVAVVSGHIWPVQLGWRGGEGFATAAGSLATFDPLFGAIVAALALLLYAVTRRVSVSGLVVLLAAPFIVLGLDRPASSLAAVSSVVVVVLFAFRKHLRRLFGHKDGTSGEPGA